MSITYKNDLYPVHPVIRSKLIWKNKANLFTAGHAEYAEEIVFMKPMK